MASIFQKQITYCNGIACRFYTKIYKKHFVEFIKSRVLSASSFMNFEIPRPLGSDGVSRYE
jgi:hypothetical protein